jgi:plasmid maintenance system killer protein
MKLYILFALIFASLAHAQDPFSYDLSLKPNGHFTIKIQQQYPAHIPLAEIMYDVFLDVDIQKQVNQDLISQTYSVNLNDTTKKMGTTNYTMTSKASKQGLTATITNKCQMITTPNSISNKCQITSSGAFLIGDVFISGSNQITCIKNNQKHLCDITVQGQTKTINMGFTSRTADRLAISGSAKTVKELYLVYKLKIDQKLPAASDSFLSKNINTLWEKLMAKLDKNEKLPRAMTIKSSNNGFVISN